MGKKAPLTHGLGIVTKHVCIPIFLCYQRFNGWVVTQLRWLRSPGHQSENNWPINWYPCHGTPKYKVPIYSSDTCSILKFTWYHTKYAHQVIRDGIIPPVSIVNLRTGTAVHRIVSFLFLFFVSFVFLFAVLFAFFAGPIETLFVACFVTKG